MKLEQAYLSARKIEKEVFTIVEVLEARVGLFECQERSRKSFSPLWRSCEARKGLFQCRERSRKPFSPLWSSCEARVGLFKCQE